MANSQFPRSAPAAHTAAAAEPTATTLEGRAYGRPAATSDDELVRVGPGTPGGELLRRYWQPFALAKDINGRPQRIKLLDEELIAFRNGEGHVGLLYPRCIHRGTDLIYGKVEDCGIRCCYHGWLFDPQGRCLETPSEPEHAARLRARQPWYPVVEQHGLLFTYMGPPEREPVFPVFSLAEDLDDDESVRCYRADSGPNGPHPKIAARADYNWWQMYDNWMDPFHVCILHATINGTQFSESLGILPEVRFEQTSDGVISIQKRTLPNGRIAQRISQVIMPNMNCTAGVTDEDLGPAGIGWTVPIDDRSYMQFGLSRVREGDNRMEHFLNIGMLKDDWGPAHGKPFSEWSLEDHQDWQTDYVAQKGQGDISLHSEEHLMAGDKGMVLARRLFKKQAQQVAQGDDPVGVDRQVPYRVEVLAGNAILDGDSHACLEGFAARV